MKKIMATIMATAMLVGSIATTTFSASAATNAKTAYMLGDANGDFRVDGNDCYEILNELNEHQTTMVSVVYVQNNLAKWFPDAVCAAALDANQDGYITETDANLILEHYASTGSGNGGIGNIGKIYYWYY